MFTITNPVDFVSLLKIYGAISLLNIAIVIVVKGIRAWLRD